MNDYITRQLVDDQLVSIINAWWGVYDRMVTSALLIPQDAFDWEYEDDYVCPELATTRQYEELQGTFLYLARCLVSRAQDIGLISLDDWHTINHILWFAGTDEPIKEDYWE